MLEINRTFKAGTLDDFSGSMAEEMEKAFAKEWQKLTGNSLPEIGEKDRRMIFTAIAQGVIKHLVERAGASFQLDVETEQIKEDNNLIKSDIQKEYINTQRMHNGRWESEINRRIKKEDLEVKQKDNNWIKSTGKPTIVRVKYEGEL